MRWQMVLKLCLTSGWEEIVVYYQHIPSYIALLCLDINLSVAGDEEANSCVEGLGKWVVGGQ